MIYIDHHYCKKNMNILIKKNILLQIYYSYYSIIILIILFQFITCVLILKILICRSN